MRIPYAQFEAAFPDETACKSYLVARRWPNGVHCPRCGSVEVTDLGEFRWQCYECAPQTSYRFSHIAGTIFENTNKPLRDWFKVTHLMVTSRKGMSALQIMRYMGFGSYKTAWGMCHKVRAALVEPEIKLGGIVEVNETLIGGKDKNKHMDKRGRGGKHAPSTKTPIVGAVRRKGTVVTRILQSINKTGAEAFVREGVSDKLACWRPMKATRSIVGSYHKVSAKYLPLYIAECQFKYNNRFNDDIFSTVAEGC